MNYNEIAAEAHALSVKSGKWAANPTFEKCILEVHAKLTDAWREWEKKNDTIYYLCSDKGALCDGQCYAFDTKTDARCRFQYYRPEPRGVAIELASVVLLILDIMAELKIEIDNMAGMTPSARDFNSFSRLITLVHDKTAASFAPPDDVRMFDLLVAIRAIECYCDANDIDLAAAIRIKLDYDAAQMKGD